MFGEKPFKDHRNSPPITIYSIDDDADVMEPLNCLYCKRTFVEVKGIVVSIIMTPQSIAEFGIAHTVRCKLCHQNYRLVSNAQIIQR